MTCLALGDVAWRSHTCGHVVQPCARSRRGYRPAAACSASARTRPPCAPRPPCSSCSRGCRPACRAPRPRRASPRRPPTGRARRCRPNGASAPSAATRARPRADRAPRRSRRRRPPRCSAAARSPSPASATVASAPSARARSSPSASARGRDDAPGAEQLRRLHRDLADDAARAEHEHGLALGEPPAPLERQPRGEAGDAEADRERGSRPSGTRVAVAGFEQRPLGERAERLAAVLEVDERAVRRAGRRPPCRRRRAARGARARTCPVAMRMSTGFIAAPHDLDDLGAGRLGVGSSAISGTAPCARRMAARIAPDTTIRPSAWTTPPSPTTTRASSRASSRTGARARCSRSPT